MSHRLNDVRYVREYVLRVAYDDGVSGEVDLSGELHGEVFEPLRSLQLAFRVAPGAVASRASTLKERGVNIIAGPIDRTWGHRTLFFRDPDGTVLGIYAEV